MDNLIASIPGIVDRMYIEGWNTHEPGDLRRDLFDTYLDVSKRMTRGGDPETTPEPRESREVYP